MRIIRRGKEPANRTHTVTCVHCRTKFEFAEKEAEYVSDQRDGDALKIECPVCKEEVWTVAN